MRSSEAKKRAQRSVGAGGRLRHGSHANLSRRSQILSRLRESFLRPQNIVYFLIFATFCFTFPLLLGYTSNHRYFAVREVVVVGTERLDESQVQRWMGLLEGRSIWSASPKTLETELERQPAVAVADVRRLLPDRFHVTIAEEAPRALLRAGSNFYHVSEQAEIIASVTRPDAALPIVSLDSEKLPTPSELREALAVVSLFEKGAGGIAVSEVEIDRTSDRRVLVAHAASGRLTVRLGWGDWSARLAALSRVVADVSGPRAEAGFVDTGHLTGTVEVLDAQTVVARWRTRGGAA